MVMLSDLLCFRLEDMKRQRARLSDVAVDLAVGDYPPVTRIFYTGQGRHQAELPWEAVQSLDWGLKRIVVRDFREGRAAPSEALARAVLLRRDIMDALVVDVALRQTMRANDLWLRAEGGSLALGGADVSPWAVARRLSRGLVSRWTRPRSEGAQAAATRPREGEQQGKEPTNGLAEPRLLDWKDLEFLRGDPRLAREGRDYHRAITRLHPSEIARLLDSLPYMHAAELLTIIPDGLAADTLEEMGAERQLQVYGELDPDQACRLVARMAPDAAADLAGRLESDEVRELLEALPACQRDSIVDLLGYPVDSAGGIMTNTVPFLEAGLTVGQAREALRQQLGDPDFVYYVYVVASLEDRRLVGVITLRNLLLAPDSRPVEDVLEPEVEAVGPLDSAAEAARRVVDRQLAAVPVVDSEGRLLGVVTVDAAMRQLAPASWREQRPKIFS